jgi:hypothetical protein
MEDSEFDALTRKLAAPVSRRTVFKAAIASVVGGIGALATFGRAGAAPGPNCRGLGTPCKLYGQASAECCTGYCTPSGTCGCPSGKTECQGSCVPVCTGGRVLNASTCTCGCASGTQFCNATAQCVPACTGGQVFNPATCTCSCPSGTVSCTPAGGGPATCCPPNQICSNGICCPNGQVNVNGACCPSGAVCTGATGTSCCPQGYICSNGSCVSFCMV